MWKKNILLLLGLIFWFASPAFAYDLTLTKIGSMSTIGADYSLVSYTGAVPSLEGTATPAAQVAVKIGTATSYVTAATASGVWSYTPTSLSTGDNSVLITSGTQQLSFVLRFNASTVPTTAASVSATVTVLPESGTWEYVLFGFLAGVGVWYLGRDLKRRMKIWEKG